MKSRAKAERVDHRRPPIDRMDKEAIDGLLPPEELDRRPGSRLTAGDIKRAAARAKGAMGASKKLDPSLRIARTRAGPPPTDGMKKSRAAPAARRSLDKGSLKASAAEAPRRVRKSNAEIAEADTSTARRRPAPRPARTTVETRPVPKTRDKRTGGTRQRVPAPGNVVVGKTKRELVTGQPPARKTGVKSQASTGGRKPPKRSARAGRPSGAGRSKGASGKLYDTV
ncbi:MAG TPA: hypothetical protein VHN20_02595 [Beijerinckiaceae bacterium]|nr:hypothetical protein [Beijerinckiaceae bacterium]